MNIEAHEKASKLIQRLAELRKDLHAIQAAQGDQNKLIVQISGCYVFNRINDFDIKDVFLTLVEKKWTKEIQRLEKELAAL